MTTDTVLLPLPHAIQGGFAVPTPVTCHDPHAALDAGFALLPDVDAWIVHLARQRHRDGQVAVDVRDWEHDPYWPATGSDMGLVRAHEGDRSSVLIGLLLPVRYGLLADRLAATCALALMRGLGVDTALDLQTSTVIGAHDVLRATGERRIDERMLYQCSARRGITTLTSLGLERLGLQELMVDDIPRGLVGQVFDVVKGLCVVLQSLAAELDQDAAFLEIPAEVVVTGRDVALALGVDDDPWAGRSVALRLHLDVHVTGFESPWLVVRSRTSWFTALKGLVATTPIRVEAAPASCPCCQAEASALQAQARPI